ncbi:MAG: phosphatase PAP2/dual specificity phosphatase family protein [Castellaniella sp.]|uniref:phosphatase PAP2/dual specificity phosphatase family protein n=1 Tax=Castellaniella sp. TaxID=1955812 RepID=UPI003A8BF4EF
MSGATPAHEPGLWKRGILWLLMLGPFFFLSYGFANWVTSQRAGVGSVVFAWEQAIPLLPWTIIPYWSIDLLYGLSFLLPHTRREMDRHAERLLTAQILCVACFLIWPLTFSLTRPPLDGPTGWLFDVLMGFDQPFNQAPSLHIVLLVVLWARYAAHTPARWRWLLHGWFLLIGISVLTTWQHHFIDVPTGLLAGFLCLWLWPDDGPSPLATARLTQDPRRRALALRYCVGALGLALIGQGLGGAALWLYWPAVSLLMVALNYLAFDAAGFQKQLSGRLSASARWLFAPYLVGAWINSRLWTRRAPEPVHVMDNIWLGRLPAAHGADRFDAIVDLCAELPLHPENKPYCSLPVLDLTAPDSALCVRAATAIENLRPHGTVLVCCALGYSRSATAIAAWMLHTGRYGTSRDALARLRAARPHVVLTDAQLLALAPLARQPSSSEVAAHGI